jgi:hypothetical protein
VTQADAGARERVGRALEASLCLCAASMQLAAVLSFFSDAAAGARAAHVTQTVVRTPLHSDEERSCEMSNGTKSKALVLYIQVVGINCTGFSKSNRNNMVIRNLN